MNDEAKTIEEGKDIICEFYVAGVQFHELSTCLKEMEVGEPLILTLEPDNRFDPNAVRIERGDTMLGYVPQRKGDLSAKVSAMMSVKNLYCEVLEVNPELKTWEQLKVRIYSLDEGN